MRIQNSALCTVLYCTLLPSGMSSSGSSIIYACNRQRIPKRDLDLFEQRHITRASEKFILKIYLVGKIKYYLFHRHIILLYILLMYIWVVYISGNNILFQINFIRSKFVDLRNNSPR